MIKKEDVLKIKTIRFTTTDGLWLGGILYKPKIKTDTVIISIHGAQSALIRERELFFGNNVSQSGIAYFSFNNRSTAILERFNKTMPDGSIKRVLYGSANDILKEGFFDIESAVNLMLDYGYKKIILLGHCLGCVKILDYFNRKSDNIVDTACFISPSDVINYQKQKLGTKYDEVLYYAKQNRNKLELMKDWVLEITPKTYFDYFNKKSINNYLNYETNFVKKWKNIPHRITLYVY